MGVTVRQDESHLLILSVLGVFREPEDLQDPPSISNVGTKCIRILRAGASDIP